MSNPEAENGTFWDHLDQLRGCIIRSLAIVAAMAVVCFCLKETLFDIILAPTSSAFITYQLLGVEPFKIHLMNTGLTEQFMIHMKTSLYCGFLIASPYVLYQLFGFVAPALYDNEKRHAVKVVTASYTMFIIGTAINYFLIFPLTVRFLGTYQVSPDVANMLTLQSYADTLMSMSLVMGLVFELPVLSWLLAVLGFINSRMMASYRKHAFVAILIVSAIITPTTDVFTLFVVALPVYLLYEVSIGIVRITRQQK